MSKLEIGTEALGESAINLAPARRLVFGASELPIQVLDGRGKPDQAWVTSAVDSTSGCIYACIVTAGVPMEADVEQPLTEQLLASFVRQGWPEVVTPLSGSLELPRKVQKLLAHNGILVDEQLRIFEGLSKIEIVVELIDEAITRQENHASLPTVGSLAKKVTSWLHDCYHSHTHPLLERIRTRYVDICCA